jgi:glucose/arabinose dehydrogenase
VTVVLAASAAQAHPPDDPYDDTVFARISGPGGPRIDLEVAAKDLTSPVKAVTAPGDASGLYVVDQPGKLWRVDLVTGTKALVLDVSGRLVPLGVCGPGTFDERGFLGVAFHPNYGSNGKLYTYTSEPAVGMRTFPSTVPPGTAPDHQNVLAEWTVRGGVADPASRRELLRVDWPQFNHDGGDLAFGPDRMLYVSMGDGGSADDADGQLFTTAPPNYPPCGEAPTVGHQGDGNAQKLNTPLGKVLRIDVDGRTSANGQYGIPSDNPFVGTAGALGEVYALGFRNPYRFSFDTETGMLFVGDVGQNDLEEVDVVTRGGNYGWNFREGSFFFHINGNDPASPAARPTPPGRSRRGCWTRWPSTTPTTRATRSSAASSTTEPGSRSWRTATCSASTRGCSSSRRPSPSWVSPPRPMVQRHSHPRCRCWGWAKTPAVRCTSPATRPAAHSAPTASF